MQKGSVREEGDVVSESEEHQGLDETGLELKLQQSVNKIVREAVLSGFAHFGNKNVVDSLLYILELEHSVNLHNLAFDITSFRSGINAMFGAGGYILEERVSDELARYLGIDKKGRNLETLIVLLIDSTRERLE